MKRLLALSLVLVVCGSAVGCGGEDDGPLPAEPPPPNLGPVFGRAEGAVTERRLVVGDAWTCALSQDRNVTCFGELVFARTREGARVRAPARVVEALAGAVELSGGTTTLCARDADGNVACMEEGGLDRIDALAGGRSLGAAGRLVCVTLEGGRVRCAQGGALRESVGADVDDALDVRAVGARVCARRSAHPITCWSADDHSVNEAAEEGPHAPLAIADVGGRPCPITEEGLVACAATRALGFVARQFDGRGTRYCGTDPQGVLHCREGARPFAPYPSDSPALEVRVGEAHACVRREADRIECWGEDRHGQSSGVPPPSEASLSRVLELAPATALALAERRACALLEGGALACWTDEDARFVPVSLPALAGIAAARPAVCGWTAAGEVHCLHEMASVPALLDGVSAPRGLVGDGAHEPLLAVGADGTPSLVAVPRPGLAGRPPRALPLLRGATDLAFVEGARACGLSRGNLVCDGDEAALEPRPDGIARFFAGGGARFAVRRDGVVLAWGRALGGMLGSRRLDPATGGFLGGDPLSWDTPAPVPDLARPAHMLASSAASCALFEGALPRCAGLLRVGPASTLEQEHFTEIAALGLVHALALSGSSGCVIDGEGAVSCWGRLRADGHARMRTSPTLVELSATPASR